jgi:hypothetical protein
MARLSLGVKFFGPVFSGSNRELFNRRYFGCHVFGISGGGKSLRSDDEAASF